MFVQTSVRSVCIILSSEIESFTSIGKRGGRRRIMRRKRRRMENLNEKVEIPAPTYNEINGIIQKLRNNKAPGPDNIISELIKEGVQRLKHRIYIC